MYAEELAKLELKFKEQLKTNENLKLQLAAEEDCYKVSSADRSFTHTGAASFQAAQPMGQFLHHPPPPTPTDYGCFRSRREALMLSLLLKVVTLTVLFMSRPIGQTIFYCCLCQTLETRST